MLFVQGKEATALTDRSPFAIPTRRRPCHDMRETRRLLTVMNEVSNAPTYVVLPAKVTRGLYRAFRSGLGIESSALRSMEPNCTTLSS